MVQFDSKKVSTENFGSVSEDIYYDGEPVGRVFLDKKGKYQWMPVGSREYFGPYESKDLAIHQAVDEWFREHRDKR
jgi:hypothetical protein